MKGDLITKLPYRSVLIFLFLSSLLSLSACATKSTLSTRASQVRLVSALEAHAVEGQCKFLGNVSAIDRYHWSWLFWGNLYGGYWDYDNKALNELLDHAAELGATHVFVNLGNGRELRGEAYCCAYCRGPDGRPDTEYCEDEKGALIEGLCQDAESGVTGTAHCEDAEGDDQDTCKENGGKWVPALTQAACESRGNQWIPKPEDRKPCEKVKGIWFMKAKDQISCEAKGGQWVINEEVLRLLPLKLKKMQE